MTSKPLWRAALAGTVLLAAASAAQARGDVYWSIGINAPLDPYGATIGTTISNAPAPLYHRPAPVYVRPAPVYVQPAPIYYAPAPVYYHAPRPVVVRPQPIYYAPAPVYQAPPRHPHWRGHDKHWKRHDRGHDRYDDRGWRRDRHDHDD